MKPRITIAETTLPDGASFILEEHDAKMSLVIHGQQICGPATKACEEELTRLACAPFRPARQPKILFVGLGLGYALATASIELKQKRASFIVVEPMKQLVDWHRQFIDHSPLHDPSRVSVQTDCSPQSLRAYHGSLHAIITFIETTPLSLENRPWIESPAWLSAAFDALQPGGMLAIGSLRPSRPLTRQLRRAGFDVAESSVASSHQARRARPRPVWLARKPGRTD